MSGQWPPEWEDSDTGLPDEWDVDAAWQDDPEASGVTSFLASVPSPVLPAGFEARISAAIAAEATARADRTDDAKTTGRSAPLEEFSPAAEASGPATAAKRRRRTSTAARRSRPGGSRPDGRRRRLRMPPTAVLAPLILPLVIVVFAIVFIQFGSSPSSSSAPDSSGTSAAGSAAPAFRSEQAGANRQPAPFVVAESGTRYQESTLVSQVRDALASPAYGIVTPAALPIASSTSGATHGFTSDTPSSAGPMSTVQPTALAGCVARLTGGVRPSLVDRATYNGSPAYIIAVPSRVWVVGLGCTAADPQQITSVSLAGLFRESQRPRIG
jgi:hypothetical protein